MMSLEIRAGTRSHRAFQALLRNLGFILETFIPQTRIMYTWTFLKEKTFFLPLFHHIEFTESALLL